MLHRTWQLVYREFTLFHLVEERKEIIIVYCLTLPKRGTVKYYTVVFHLHYRRQVMLNCLVVKVVM